MPVLRPPTRKFEPGSTGWTVDDLRDPAVRRAWDAGRYEIIEGVVTSMPPPLFDHGKPIGKLTYWLEHYARANRLGWDVVPEVDVAAAEDRVFRVDLIVMSPADVKRQAAVAPWGTADDAVGVIAVPPTLVVESVSQGHERHDRVTKRRLYAAFGIRHYWIVDRRERSLACLSLSGKAYRQAAAGTGDAVVKPPAFKGLEIPLAELWGR